MRGVPLIEWQIKPQSDSLSSAPAAWRIINEPYRTFHIFGATTILDRAHEIATGLRNLVQSVRVIGAEVVIVGIRAWVAQTMLQSAMPIEGLRVGRDVTMALEQVYAMLHGHSPAEHGWRNEAVGL